MLSLSWLTADQHAEFEHRLAHGYDQRTLVSILNNEDELISTVSPWIMEGQVDVRVPDYDRPSERIEVSRSAGLTLLDPDHALGFDSDSPSDGSMYLDRMIGLHYGVRCSFGWVDVPVFTGPLTSVQRDGELLTIEAESKELFGLSAANHTKSYKKGRVKADVFVDLVKSTGEDPALIDRPDSNAKLVRTFNIEHESHYWFQAYRIADSIGRVAYYDGPGRCRCTVKPERPSWAFAYGNGGMLLSAPSIKYSIDDLDNSARVTGGTPKGSKKEVIGTAVAEASSPLAPLKLGRRGVGRFLLATDSDSSLDTKKEVNAAAKRALEDGLAQQVETEFTALPVPHLEPWDVVVVNAPHFATETRINRFSLPLTHDGAMTVGFIDRVTSPLIPIPRRAA